MPATTATAKTTLEVIPFCKHHIATLHIIIYVFDKFAGFGQLLGYIISGILLGYGSCVLVYFPDNGLFQAYRAKTISRFIRRKQGRKRRTPAAISIGCVTFKLLAASRAYFSVSQFDSG